VVDEAYADLERDMVAAATLLAGNGRVVVLRSFGKSYGLAGIRLGFLLASPPVAAAAAALLGPWPVGGLALAAGRQALSDRAWRRRTAVRVTQASARLDAVLRAAGLTIRGGTGLFRLADTEAAGSLWRRLAQHGILVRRFDDHPSWLRFGLPADEPAWDRLERFFSADRA
jgi:cobalamin biosynthetic protein CobC